MRATLIDNITGERIPVRSTTRHPASSYGFPIWVDADNNPYCQCDLPCVRYTVEMSVTDRRRKEIGEAIAKARAERGLTVRSLAKLSGVTAANINRIENGNYNAGIDIISRICAALGAELKIE